MGKAQRAHHFFSTWIGLMGTLRFAHPTTLVIRRLRSTQATPLTFNL